MRLLTFTNLYPGEDRPRHGIFVEERLRQLVATGAVTAQVVALRPSAADYLTGGYGGLRRAPCSSSRHGIPIAYTPVPTLPGVSNWIDPWFWARSAQTIVERVLGEESADTILDAHFLYPDAVAAVIIGKRLGLPTVMTARGSDVNVKCRNPVMRAWIRWAAANCSALITVSRSLAQKLTAERVSAPLLEVLPNGVDLEKFRPENKETSRARLGVGGRILLSVGHLVPEKGHDIAIEALAGLPGVSLLIVGEGRELDALRNLAHKLGVSQRVKFLGFVPHDEMRGVYAAADVLVLPSVREGMPNVVLESLACGTPVIGTTIGGIAELLTSPSAGELMHTRSPDGLREAFARLFGRGVTVADTRSYAEQFGWGAVIEKQLTLYRRVLAGAPDGWAAAGARLP